MKNEDFMNSAIYTPNTLFLFIISLFVMMGGMSLTKTGRYLNDVWCFWFGIFILCAAFVFLYFAIISLIKDEEEFSR